VLATLAVSFSAILIRIAGDDAATIVWVRMGMASALLLPFALRSGRVSMQRAALLPTATSGVLLAGHFLLWTASLQYTSVAASVLLVSLHPLLVAPLVLMLVLSAMPQLDVQLPAPWFHFQVVSFTSLVALVAAILIGSLSGPRSDVRALFVTFGLSAIAAVFLLGRASRRPPQPPSRKWTLLSTSRGQVRNARLTPDGSFRKASTSSGIGGRPMRSKVTRRIQVCRSAGGARSVVSPEPSLSSGTSVGVVVGLVNGVWAARG